MNNFKKYLMINNTMCTVGYTAHHSKPMASIEKIYLFIGHTNKPIKQPSH